MMSIDHLQLKRSLPRVLSPSCLPPFPRGLSFVPPSPSLGLPLFHCLSLPKLSFYHCFSSFNVHADYHSIDLEVGTEILHF